MKTSTMIIITAVLITLGCLTAFNYTLKTVSLSGNYKSPFREMEFTPLNAVNKINIEDANRMGITIKQGNKEGIWIKKDIKDKIQVDAAAHQLTLAFSSAARQSDFRCWPEQITIITKDLAVVTTHSSGQNSTTGDHEYSHTQISGYHSDQLDLEISSMVSIYLNSNQLKTLNAIVGSKREGKASLILSSDATINTASFNVPGSSELTLMDPKIVKTSYNLSDSATVSLNGKVVQMIR